jgi:hypothetical protein
MFVPLLLDPVRVSKAAGNVKSNHPSLIAFDLKTALSWPWWRRSSAMTAHDQGGQTTSLRIYPNVLE